MEAFVELTGMAAPLLRSNMDTDLIIPMERMLNHSISREGLGPHLLAALRFNADGSENTDCVLNHPLFKNARILLAGENFGCGSSREPAVWTLIQYGIRCVIAPSYGGIFANNCFKNGLLPVHLPAAQIQALAAVAEQGEMTVSLSKRRVLAPGGLSVEFSIEDFRRTMMMEGLDQIGLAQSFAADIDSFQLRDRTLRPWIYDWQRA